MRKPCVLRISEVERDGERQGEHSGPHKLTCQRERERKRKEKHTSVLFSINLLLLGKHSLRETTFVTFRLSPTDFVSQTVAGRSGRNRRSENHQSREASLFGTLPLFASHRQLMNDLFVTLTQIENCRRSRVLFGLREKCLLRCCLTRVI